MKLFKRKYRIVTDEFGGFKIQFRLCMIIPIWYNLSWFNNYDNIYDAKEAIEKIQNSGKVVYQTN